MTDHRKKHHFKERFCRYYHGNGAACRFPDNICIDIHENHQHQQQQHGQGGQQQHGNDSAVQWLQRFKCQHCQYETNTNNELEFHTLSVHQQQQQVPQRKSVIQQNRQYRKHIPCRNGASCEWLGSPEGCRYEHRESNAPGSTTAVDSEQLKELISLVQAGLNLTEVPDVQSMADFPRLGYSKSKSV